MDAYFYDPKGHLTNCLEVIKIHGDRIDSVDKAKIFGVKISQDGNDCYTFSVQHTGPFNLRDYEKLELEIKSAKLVRKS